MSPPKRYLNAKRMTAYIDTDAYDRLNRLLGARGKTFSEELKVYAQALS